MFEVKILPPVAIIRDFISHETFAEKRQTALDFRSIEGELRGKGIRVWLAWTENKNEMMLKILSHLGAKPYFSDDNNVYFAKDLMEV